MKGEILQELRTYDTSLQGLNHVAQDCLQMSNTTYYLPTIMNFSRFHDIRRQFFSRLKNIPR